LVCTIGLPLATGASPTGEVFRVSNRHPACSRIEVSFGYTLALPRSGGTSCGHRDRSNSAVTPLG
jgi:hypothetical protein